TPEGVRAASIVVENGIVSDVASGVAEGALDFGDLVVMPGLVDTHVHVNEPGRTEWEGFETATRAAAAGGVTTIFDMPLNSVPPTTSVAALSEKIAAAAGKCFVDVGFWGGVVPGNVGELAGMKESGVPGFKCFFVPSGVAEFADVEDDDLVPALREIARLGAVLLVHAEDPRWLADAPADGDPRTYATYLATRPPRAENQAIERLVDLSRESGGRIHVVHLSSAGAIAHVESAPARGA